MLLVAAAGAGVGMLGRGVWPQAASSLNSQLGHLHLYRDPGTSIAKVRLQVFYAVPQDRIDRADTDWQARIQPALDQMRQFQKFQFRGQSELMYELYPEPVILEHPAQFYDTDHTDGGNPAALVAVAAELKRRVFDSKGNLYRAGFSDFNPHSFPVLGVLYEGVGASGATGMFLISETYFKDAAYEPFRAALMDHEFGHALGFPDRYDMVTGAPAASDIMGSGRHRPIEHTYIGYDLLKETGLNIN